MEYDPVALRRALAASWICDFDYRELVGSTNDLALRRAVDHTAGLPLLVLADRQLAGRGRGANRWWSPRGAVTFSIVTEVTAPDGGHAEPTLAALPVAPAPRTVSPLIAIAAGLSVCEALTQIHPPLHVGLKWPNDVFVDNRKIAGVLVEVSHHAPNRVVIGIGVNVNNRLADADPELQPTAIALADVTHYAVPLLDVLTRIIDQLGEHLREMAVDAERLVARWQTHCMLSGRRIQVRSGHQVLTGTCRGISRDGALQIETDQGIRICYAGTVRLESV